MSGASGALGVTTSAAVAAALAELRELLDREAQPPPLPLPPPPPNAKGAAAHFAGPAPWANPTLAYNAYRATYLRWLSVYSRLEAAYQATVEPQARIDTGRLLELVIARLAVVRGLAAKWHPVPPDVTAARAGTPFKPLPWHFVEWDDLLEAQPPNAFIQQPEDTELRLPSQFLDDTVELRSKRDAMVSSIVTLKLGVGSVAVELEDGAPACRIQRIARGIAARALVARMRQQEKEFLNMAPTHALAASLERLETSLGSLSLETAAKRAANAAAYAAALPGIAQSVERDEGLDFSDAMRAERNAWLVAALADAPGTVPESVEAYYAAGAAAAAALAEGAAGAAAAGAAGGKGGKGAPAKAAPAKAAKPDAKKGGKAGGGVEVPSEVPPLLSCVEAEVPWAAGIWSALLSVRNGRTGRSGTEAGVQLVSPVFHFPPVTAAAGGSGAAAAASNSPAIPPIPSAAAAATAAAASAAVAASAAIHGDLRTGGVGGLPWDDGVARSVVRPGVVEAVRLTVDAGINDMLTNLRATLPKGKKAKKKAKKAKKPKAKKVKPLPGAKACAGMAMPDYLALLAEMRCINTPRPTATFSSFLGGPSLSSSHYWATDSSEQRSPTPPHDWVPPPPAFAQVREAITATCVLPLGSSAVRRMVHAASAAHGLWGGHAPRSLLLSGASGTGKTHLVQAIAHATGALLINLSAGNVEGKLTDKGGHAKLLHAAFEVAKDPALAPVIIYIDEVEKLLPVGGGGGKGKKGAAAAAGGDGGLAGGGVRFKKDLPTYIASLLPEEHRALIIGCSSDPMGGDPKLLKECFDVILSLPMPDHGTRLLVWRHALAEAFHVAAVAEAEAAAAAAAAKEAASAEIGVGGGVTSGGTSPTAAMSVSFAAAVSTADMVAPRLAPGFSHLPLSTTAALCHEPTSTLPPRFAHMLQHLNLTALAGLSAGYTVGAIRRAVATVLTPARFELMRTLPLEEVDFCPALARCERVWGADAEKLRLFGDVMTGYAEGRTKAEVVDPKAKAKDVKKKK